MQFHGTSFPHGIALMWRAVQVPPCRFSCVCLAAIFEYKLPSPGSSAGFLPPCCRHLLLRRLRFLSIITALCAAEFACGLAVVFSVQSRFFVLVVRVCIVRSSCLSFCEALAMQRPVKPPPPCISRKCFRHVALQIDRPYTPVPAHIYIRLLPRTTRDCHCLGRSMCSSL